MVRKRENLERVREFFHWAARRSFWDLDIRESRVTDYIADVLTNFVRTENLYPFRNQRGERLETIAEMLLEANLITLSGGTLQREREIRKHIGDYVLFMAGIFPEYIKRRSLFDYYLEEGAKAYWSVSELDRALLRPGAMLFQELASRFELYVGALNYMRKAFFRDTLGDPYSFGVFREETNPLKEVSAMPTYEFHCPKCNESFTLTLRLQEYEEKKYSCPKCGGKDLKQLITPFLTKTSKKS